jgi:two-component system cell cycle response regulator
MTIEIISQQKIDELRSAGKLPSPGGVALAIMEKSQQEGVTVQEIALLIQSDPALAGRLMKYANSAAMGGRRPIASVPDAVHRVGLSAVRHLVLGFSLISSTRYAPCPGFDYPLFWARSLATAIANRALSLQTHASADEAFTFGLLCEIGKLALASLYPDSFGEVLAEASSGKQSLLELENQHYAIDHRILTHALLKDWGFPNVFLETAYYYEDPDASAFEQGSRPYSLVHGLHLASCLAEACLMDEEARRNRLPPLFAKAARLGIEADELLALCARIDLEWREWGNLLGIPTQHLLSVSSPPPSLGESETPSPLPDGANSVAPLRVLAVDDDPILRTLLEKLLVLKGYQVRVAKDGREGLRLTIEFAPQIIITDWKMPEMDGLAMCRALRGSEEGEKVYIILLTAQETEDALVEAFDAGADDYIVKPFNKRVLMARLRAGERIIRLHKVLEQTARTEDLSCRLGGEEFLVICPETGLKAAQTVAERIR